MGVLLNSPLTKRGEGVEVAKAAGVARVMGALVTPTDLLPPMEEGKKDGFSSKIHIPKFSGKKGHSGDVTESF